MQGMHPKADLDHRFKFPAHYRDHESKHTGKGWKFDCACGWGGHDKRRFEEHQRSCGKTCLPCPPVAAAGGSSA